MTDNGLAALAAALEHEGDACSYDAATDSLRCPGSEAHIGLARRLLGERGVFLPEGLAEEWDWRQERDALMGLIESGGATIAALRAALDGLVDFAWHKPTCGFLRTSTVSHPVICNCSLTAALAAAKETE